MSYPTQWQGPGQGRPWQDQGGAGAMLASHADRERAVDVLRAGFGEGRLRQEELEKRITRAYEARTVGELSLLVADLPQGPVPQSAAFQGQQAAFQPVPPTFLPAPLAPTNSKAIGAMVCGVLTLVTGGATGLPAVILGHTARGEIRRTGEGGDGFALTGLVLGWLAVAGWSVLLVFLVVVAASSH
ncbi:DUF1707 and DUF4190 domain-containing protein [Streptomyces sp. NPDC005423]|uniref:DUF1707 and DUF4190 domain-containing protein n=1 Tax=Streptomyces sp. NPDC005423 TaxID=3155343 RepID=UPI0033BDCFA7